MKESFRALMCLCTLCADRFLRSVSGTAVFRAYCRERCIPFFPHAPATDRWDDDVRQWIAAVSGLRDDRRSQVEWEQAAVSELSSREGGAHLLGAAADAGLPPGTVPDGGPLALWFLLHHPGLFREVFFRHEPQDVDVWYAAQAAAGLRAPVSPAVAASLAGALSANVRERGSPEAVCAVEAHRLPTAVCFVARVKGPPRFIEGFTGGGKLRRRRQHAAACVHFVYYPHDGTVLLQSPPQSADRRRRLLTCFSETVLGSPVEAAGAAFALDGLKLPFHPPPDANDMELVRVKSLHLHYPARSGRRKLRLDTLTSDAPSAIDELLRAHGGDLAELRVAYAELHILLRADGCGKNHLVRLWPGRCDVGRGPLGDRFLACLRRWGL